MYILGINAYHGGASACLINNGKLVAAAEEERFTRQKYAAGFPVEAIRYVLREAGIAAQDVAHIGISRDPSANLMKKALFTLRRRPSLKLITNRLSNSLKVDGIERSFCDHLNLDPSSITADFHNIEHHRAHMASVFFTSPYNDALVLSVDGMGDFVSTMWGQGEGNQIKVAGEVDFPHSLGNFYTAITQWLGFTKYGDEGKVMGLAPYGDPKHIDKMRQIVRIQRDGIFKLDLDYFIYHVEDIAMSWTEGTPTLGRLYSPMLIKLLGDSRNPEQAITQYHMDIAASLQAMLEEAEFALINKLQAETGQKTLCLAGGVALNSVFNGKVLPETQFENIAIHPAASDAGTALGVCYAIYHEILGYPRTYVMEDAYTGPAFTNGEIESVLNQASLSYRTLADDHLFKEAAGIIAEGDVLGWFQGRMEWGPRALGHRSILADPRRDDMKDILNARIKNREYFRPFAPSIMDEHVGDYFSQDYPDPFMLKVYDILESKRAEIPAVTHVDGSGRLQTVDRTHSPRYWSLINAFRERTGVPVVLNTSFNENEPIVCTPQEAVDCFLRTDMDTLVVGNYVIEKTPK